MLRLFNSLTRTVEDFKPMHEKHVGMYTCGPTVYQFAHIGNFRAYSTADVLVRALKFNGYTVDFVMNITDVGHLTSDADSGEDKLEKSAKKEGKTAWEVASFYTDMFLQDYDALHLTRPTILTKATDHIKEQIALIEKLEEKGYTYQTSDGIYFDTSKFPKYGELSTLDQIKEGARVEVNPEKRHPRDFALWKFSYPDGVGLEAYMETNQSASADALASRRQMEWDSPWGVGFPGWHIECSAMSMKYLGPHFDIHTGGVDHLSIHHPDEIAQSEAATGQKFVNYWVHTAFMLVQGQKMSKSLGNVYRLYDLQKSMPERQEFDPMSLRYLYLQTHYRQEMNFTFPALEAAQNTLTHLRQELMRMGTGDVEIKNSKEPGVNRRKQTKNPIEKENEFEKRFLKAINEDLNMPQALAVVWDMLKSGEDTDEKVKMLLHWDEILGLGLAEWREDHKQLTEFSLPPEVRELVEIRKQLRKERKFGQSDQVRNQIRKLGYDIEDGKGGIRVRKLEGAESEITSEE